ncbi:MAG: uridine kinase [Candidatus Cloacimonetes bacterium]|nr:uridine kinase [Candidatus Cloacimonadota bacterium]HPM03383.1 uridine kinase [Candidatus Cloacimonadota bacterium]
MSKPVIIGIAGGSGSGKTTITKEINNTFENKVSILMQDNYYKNFDKLSMEERAKINFDHPNSFDINLFIEHIESLKNKIPIEMPIYDFKNHLRSHESIMIQPTSIIIIEGILIFDNKKLRELMDIKIFVDTDADIRILRRIQRDIKERGRSLDSIIDQYLETVRPMHIEFVEPSKRHADIIVPEGGFNKIAIDMIITKIYDIFKTKDNNQ